MPDEVTLTHVTTTYLMEHPDEAAEMERVTEAGGNAALIEWLDAHDLPWRPGGSDPAAAFADILRGVPAAAPGSRALDRRKAARKAAKKARRGNRRG